MAIPLDALFAQYQPAVDDRASPTLYPIAPYDRPTLMGVDVDLHRYT
jgi:hypothetical protein